jgi:hypothetical protein
MRYKIYKDNDETRARRQRAEMERMSIRELKQLIAMAREILAAREGTPKELPHHEVVERLKGRGGRWLQWEIVKCGKTHCSKDKDGAGHGPYAYLYCMNERTGKYTSKYVGKVVPLELTGEFGIEA